MQENQYIDTEFSGDVAAFEGIASYAVVGIGALVALAVIVAGSFATLQATTRQVLYVY